MSSWADVAKKNGKSHATVASTRTSSLFLADTEHMPEPDQGLLDGHFAGETETGAVDVDHKVSHFS